MTYWPSLRAVEVYPRMRQNLAAPSLVRKGPETFYLTSTMRASLSTCLL